MIESGLRLVEVADLALSLREVGRGTYSRAEWARLIESTQGLVNALQAVQAVAIARVASIESQGFGREVEHLIGAYTATDAPAIVASRLGTTDSAATDRVVTAMTVVADLPHTLAAMSEGRLDDYRASRVAAEVLEAEPRVRREVDARLAPELTDRGFAGEDPSRWVADPEFPDTRRGEPFDGFDPETGVDLPLVTGPTGPRLRARTRRLLAQVAPELLRARAERARAERGLTRWASEPGLEEWRAVLPVEAARPLWAAIDGRARALRSEDTSLSMEQARGDAFVAILSGQVTGTYHLTLLTADGAGAPAAEATSARAGQVEVAGFGGPGRVAVPAGWLASLADQRGVTVSRAGVDAVTGALADPGLSTAAYAPTAAIRDHVTTRDGLCRFPGCRIAARFCDLDHVRPWPLGPTTPGNLLCLCRRHHRIKQSPGWSVRVDDHGTAHWRDPTGRVRTTTPLDLR